MAVLFTSGQDVPVEMFFYATPPRQVVCCNDSASAIKTLQGSQCNHRYALVPDSVEVPDGLEIRARCPGFVLLQKKGQRTKSDRRAEEKRCHAGSGLLQSRRPYFVH